MASHDMNHGSIRTNLLSIKMITPSYGFTLLQVSSHGVFFFPKYSSNCCSITHALTCLLHNLKRHYHVHRSFQHLPIRGQTNPVHISHSIYIITIFKKILCCRHSISVHKSYLSYTTNHYQQLEMITLLLLKLQSTLNPTNIRNHPYNLSPQKMKGSI